LVVWNGINFRNESYHRLSSLIHLYLLLSSEKNIITRDVLGISQKLWAMEAD